MSGDFEKLLAICNETGRLYEPGLIFIGGIAVYLHAINQPQVEPYAEATKDADVYISLASFSDMRDIEELSQNARLSKHEFQKGGFSFDVYTERQSSLPIPYSEIAAHAQEFSGVLVASPEHLLVLKLAAAVDRHASEHGRKDAKDVIRLLLVGATEFDAELAVKFMKDEHLKHLHVIIDGPEFVALAKGNSQMAKQLRRSCDVLVKRIDRAFKGEPDLVAMERDAAFDQRVMALPDPKKSVGVALTFGVLARAAIHACGDDAKSVNWTAVEEATIVQCIEANGQLPENVAKVLHQYSPGAASMNRQKAILKLAQAIFEQHVRPAPNPDTSSPSR